MKFRARDIILEVLIRPFFSFGDYFWSWVFLDPLETRFGEHLAPSCVKALDLDPKRSRDLNPLSFMCINGRNETRMSY